MSANLRVGQAIRFDPESSGTYPAGWVRDSAGAYVGDAEPVLVRRASWPGVEFRTFNTLRPGDVWMYLPFVTS